MSLGDLNSITFRGFNIHLLQTLFPSKKKVEDHIRRIIRDYNEDKIEAEEKDHAYNSLEMRKWDAEDHHHFNAQLFYSVRTIQSKFSSWVVGMTECSEEEQKSISLHYVFFLYRDIESPVAKTAKKVEEQWELFALTTNDGYRVVQRHANYRFPNQVALRIVDPNLSAADKKSLTGTTDSSSETYRTEYPLKQNEMDTIWRWFRRYHSHFKVGSSLYNPEYELSAFESETTKKKKINKVAVAIGAGNIVIAKAMTMKQYEETLVFLSRIAREKSTYLIKEDGTPEKEIEDAGIRYLENIQLVEEGLINHLNQGLLRLVWKCFKDKGPTGGISFVHRFYKDFYTSGDFSLKYGTTTLQWNYRPSIRDILESLRTLISSKLPFDEFSQILSKILFSYSNKPGVSYPLKEFFQGDLLYQNEVYFRIDSLWLKVKADQLIVLQRDFFALLENGLLDVNVEAHLSEPWIGKTEWAAFTMEQVKKAVKASDDELKKLFEELEKEMFSFIDDKGNVLCHYPTKCILNKDQPFVKLLKKRWAELEVILKKDKITAKDLEKLLEDEKSGQQLFEALKEKRPLLTRLSSGKMIKAVVTILDAKKIPLITSLANLTFKSKAAPNHIDALEKLLSKKNKAKQPLEEDDLIDAINKRSGPPIFKELCQGLKSQSETLITGSRYICQGPIPAHIAGKKELLDHLKREHENYRKVVEEEGYNRFYLQKNNFIVGDQVYGGKKEQIELFDIMQFGSKPSDNTYLYHVKEGFGQKTREACSQIRVAATTIHNARNSGKHETLRQFYHNATKKEKDPTPFRLELKNQFEKKFVDKDKNPTVESFIDHFKKPAKQIIFVYAFIDDANEERFLAEERNPSHMFSEKDFVTDLKLEPKLGKKLFSSLQSAFLDKYGRLTEKFLRLSEGEFTQHSSLKGVDEKEATAIHHYFHGKISKFASLSAKIELLELKRYLDSLGFGFKISQISRSSNGQTIGASSFDWGVLSDGEWNASGDLSTIAFEYDKKHYEYRKNKILDEQVLALLMGLDPYHYDKQQLRLKYYQILKTKKTEEDLLPYLTFEKKMGRTEWEQIANALQIRVILLPKETNGKVITDPTKATIIADGAKKTFIFALSDKDYHRCRLKEGDAEDESDEVKKALTLRDTLSQDTKDELLANNVFAGIRNVHNDCFFNALSQFVFHSSLGTFLLDEDNVCHNPPSKKFAAFWEEFALSYHLAKGTEAVQYDRDGMRQLLAFDHSTQEDPHEALSRIFDFYKINDLLTELESTYTVDLNEKKPLLVEKGCSQLNDNDEIVTTEKVFALEVTLPDEEEEMDPLDFDEAFDAIFETKQNAKKLYFVHNKKRYYVEEYQSKVSLENPKDELFFHIKRFHYDDEGFKNSTPLSLKMEHEFNETEYLLQGFIVHHGKTMKEGHYTACCLTDEGWRKFNDGKVSKIEEEGLLKEAEQAYLISFKKK